MSTTVADSLWGEFEILEPVLVELVESAPVLRLKGIHQAGASYYLFASGRSVTRYEHSLGVMRLLQLLDAPLEEQIAGLLHDVPHTAFSHTVDALFPNEEHNFHESLHHEVISNSEIPVILERHGIPLHAAMEPDRFVSLERPLPDLCADRVDYALRDMSATKAVSTEEALDFAASLIRTETGLIANDAGKALWFARLFREANERIYTSVDDAGAYWALAGAMRRAIEVGDFEPGLLSLMDDEAMSALESSGDPIVTAFLSLLIPGTHFHVVEDNRRPFFTASMKQRRIDPLVMTGARPDPRRLSEVSSEYSEELNTAPGAGTVTYRLWCDAIPPVLEKALHGALSR